MRSFSVLILFVATANFSFGQNMGPFKIVSDTKIDVEGMIYQGSCASLLEKAKKEGEQTMARKFKDVLGMSDSTCKEAGKELVLKGKQDAKRAEQPIGPGQWAVFFKVGNSAEGLIPAFCFADPGKPGKILVLQTPKSETARSFFGKSMGFGLKCTQMDKIP